MAAALLTSSPRIIDTDPERVGTWMQQQGIAYYHPGMTCIGLERQGVIVAGVTYEQCNGASVVANLAVTGPITRRWLWFVLYYPFVQLGCEVLLGWVADTNRACQRVIERVGFVERARIPHAAPDGALRLYTLTKAHCRFLRSPHDVS